MKQSSDVRCLSTWNKEKAKEYTAMVKKKHKGYWVKRSERFSTGAEAKGRAAGLRQHQHICHVQVAKQNNHYEVLYSVAKFYVEDLKNAGVEL